MNEIVGKGICPPADYKQMKSKKIDEEIMAQRRKERLERLNFFMLDERCPPNAAKVFGLHETHNLLKGFFQNSNWQTAWYCVKYAAWNSFHKAKADVQFFYWRRILRLSDTEIDERIDNF